MPRTWVPAVGGGLVIALALPVFLVAGWRLSGWAIAAVLWVGASASACCSRGSIPRRTTSPAPGSWPSG